MARTIWPYLLVRVKGWVREAVRVRNTSLPLGTRMPAVVFFVHVAGPEKADPIELKAAMEHLPHSLSSTCTIRRVQVRVHVFFPRLDVFPKVKLMVTSALRVCTSGPEFWALVKGEIPRLRALLPILITSSQMTLRGSRKTHGWIIFCIFSYFITIIVPTSFSLDYQERPGLSFLP